MFIKHIEYMKYTFIMKIEKITIHKFKISIITTKTKNNGKDLTFV